MIDAEQIGQVFYNVGVALGEAINKIIATVQSIDWEGLQRALDAVYPIKRKQVYRKHPKPQLTAEEYTTKSNNWLRMHGYAPRRKKRR